MITRHLSKPTRQNCLKAISKVISAKRPCKKMPTPRKMCVYIICIPTYAYTPQAYSPYINPKKSNKFTLSQSKSDFVWHCLGGFSPSQDASDHQDFNMFLIGDSNLKNLQCATTGILGRAAKKHPMHRYKGNP